jgi:hypothetical protein
MEPSMSREEAREALMSEIPLPDTGLPGAAPLLNGDLWQRWSSEGRVFPLEDVRGAVGYLRLKPGVSCRITLFGNDGGHGEEPPEGYLLHLFATPERARQAFEKFTKREAVVGTGGYEPFLCEDPPVVATPFPNDPEISDLRHVYDVDRFRRALSGTRPPEFPSESWRLQKRHVRTTLLAYKPGRRAVFKVRVGMRNTEQDKKLRAYWHVKILTPKSVEPTFQNQKAIHEALPPDAEWRVPAPRGTVPSLSMVAGEWVLGTPLTKALRDSDGTGELLETLGRVGAALAGFHELDLPLEHLASPPEEAEQVRALGEDLQHLLPDKSASLKELSSRLASELGRLSTDASTILHGDFHPGQILLEDGRVVIVVLDCAGRGYAGIDLGNFVAGLLERHLPEPVIDAFLKGYEEKRALPADGVLRVATSLALFRRAFFPFRTLQADWPEKTDTLLNTAARVLEHGIQGAFQ